ERLEQLEQLRVLEYGEKIRVVPVKDGGRTFWEVNNPEDIPIVEKIIAREL
ncbi:MAG: 3-deoxy-manno-octulosonate cytidylyltransferase, partial [Gammaproteobacteria bacterium]|nr:3-deoxy-manno-octulosonate cytidylyltransferase [Gammaproteobacteria bacterium]